MAFNIDRFRHQALKSGVAKTAHFEVMITPPSSLDWQYARELMFRADSVEIPGRTISTLEHRFLNNGPINKVAYGAMYQDVSVTFILSDDMKEKRFFEEWQKLMVDTTPNGFSNTFNVKYFNDYVGRVSIMQYDQAGSLKSTHILEEAYPTIINGVQMGWSDDSIAKLTVQIAMRYYDVRKENGFFYSNEVPDL